MDIVLAPPAPDDVIGLLKAWRFWFLGGLIGALLGAAAYAILPPLIALAPRSRGFPS
jgi:uncharacterized protein involved in exopolysaccharide biosynthesis